MTDHPQSTKGILETSGKSLDTRHILTQVQDYESNILLARKHTFSFNWKNHAKTVITYKKGPKPCSNYFVNSQACATYKPLKSKQ